MDGIDMFIIDAAIYDYIYFNVMMSQYESYGLVCDVDVIFESCEDIFKKYEYDFSNLKKGLVEFMPELIKLEPKCFIPYLRNKLIL